MLMMPTGHVAEFKCGVTVPYLSKVSAEENITGLEPRITWYKVKNFI